MYTDLGFLFGTHSFCCFLWKEARLDPAWVKHMKLLCLLSRLGRERLLPLNTTVSFSKSSQFFLFYSTITEYRYRVLSFLSSGRNWDSPTPLDTGDCAPLHPLVRGEGTLACGRGVGGSPNSNGGHTLWCFLYISTLWVQYTVLTLSRTVRATVHMRKLSCWFPKKCWVNFCLLKYYA
jgi:hypothetical protein